MSFHHGTVELLDSNGEVLQEVLVYLQTEVDPNSDLASWGGRIEESSITPADWLDATQVRMPDGKVGQCSVTNETISSAGSRTGWLLGSGPAPF